MLSEKAKELFAKLDMEYPAVAIKYHAVKPQDVAAYEGEKLAFCQYVKYAQLTDKTFYITKDDDACYGQMALGMIPKPAVTASGQAGYDFEVYRTPIAGQQLYQKLPVLLPGTVNYVQFAQVSFCDFDPDLIICVADLPQSDILMRATSYISGDLWESKSSPVISCAWMYAYPVISGKANHITTGYYHGLKRRKTYPAGLRIIAIPFQKIDEVVAALDEMPWTTIAFRNDDESKRELEQRIAHWQEMASELNCSVHLH
ncbi:MAG: DUF169 domain-containing protein [Clostridiales bacterium]|nr:DUF169 domain-containing protein [Clostridiales bacterium]